MSRVWPVSMFHSWDRCLLILVDSRLKISLEKKSRQIQAERSDFILNPGPVIWLACGWQLLGPPAVLGWIVSQIIALLCIALSIY